MNTPLDSRQLRAFCTLAKVGSFTQAAKQLHLSQSAVSHSMRALEEEVGCRLLDRMGKKVLLTQAGEQLLQHAERILAESASARAALRQLGTWGHGRLRIGASVTACQYLLPPVLREFKNQFPSTPIFIEPGDSAPSIVALEENRIDLALALEPPHDDRFSFEPLFTDELHFLVPPHHPWAAARHVVREEIPRQNYVLYSKASHTFGLIARYFSTEKMVLNGVIELGSIDAIKELVQLDLGISILAPWVARRELIAGTLVALPLGRRKLRRTWGIIRWNARRLTMPAESFISFCRRATRRIAAGEPDGREPVQQPR